LTDFGFGIPTSTLDGVFERLTSRNLKLSPPLIAAPKRLAASSMIDDLWYKDSAVGTYMDANGVGVGDFKGLLRRLDDLHGLGITTIRLMPFQPSPGKDDGYDISNYYGADPRYGIQARSCLARAGPTWYFPSGIPRRSKGCRRTAARARVSLHGVATKVSGYQQRSPQAARGTLSGPH
jgi:hypothetical protein